MTRAEFLAAVRVLDEGAPTHSMYAIEDAKDAIKPIARYHWRQGGVTVFCIMLGAIFAFDLLPDWPWFAAYFTVGMASVLASVAITTLPPLRTLFVPAGFKAGDVSTAFYQIFGRPST